MREGAPPVAIAHRPDARHIGPKLVVDFDVAAGILSYPGAVEPEIVGVWPPSGRHEQVGSPDLASAPVAVESHDDLAVALRDMQAFGVGADIDAFAAQERRDRLGHILVLARNEARAYLYDRDLAAEAAIHLSELEPDIAPAQHQEMPRQVVDVQHRAVGEIVDRVQTGDVGHHRPAADIDEDPVGAQDLRADLN